MLFRFFVRLKWLFGLKTNYERDIFMEAAARLVDSNPDIVFRGRVTLYASDGRREYVLALEPLAAPNGSSGPSPPRQELECQVCTCRFPYEGKLRCPSCNSNSVQEV